MFYQSSQILENINSCEQIKEIELRVILQNFTNVSFSQIKPPTDEQYFKTSKFSFEYIHNQQDNIPENLFDN